MSPAAPLADLPQGLQQREPLLWLNPEYDTMADGHDRPLDPGAAETRFERCEGLLARLFPELVATDGRLASPLDPVPRLQAAMEPATASGLWFLKRDDALPVAGSVKARGGFHEVLSIAEAIGAEAGLLPKGANPEALAGDAARTLLGRHTLTVGSTGNLGLAIGLIGAGLGFRVVVHVSAGAKDWKKQRLRDRGIEVIEHEGDYAAAVEAGRAAAEADPAVHFIDDEHSEALFLGYAAAARELLGQLAEAGRRVDAKHPLFVYLPCGVGGAPGGILYGLKRLLGANVHGFFAEPAASPCMLVQLAAGTGSPVSVHDAGLDNKTEADGLAVGRASPLVAPIIEPLLSGIFTVDDAALFDDACRLEEAETIYVEPSAAAGLRGPRWLLDSAAGRDYLRRHAPNAELDHATHVIWATGGALVPEPVRNAYRRRA